MPLRSYLDQISELGSLENTFCICVRKHSPGNKSVGNHHRLLSGQWQMISRTQNSPLMGRAPLGFTGIPDVQLQSPRET